MVGKIIAQGTILKYTDKRANTNTLHSMKQSEDKKKKKN